MKSIIVTGVQDRDVLAIADLLTDEGYTVNREVEGSSPVFILEPMLSYRNDGERSESEDRVFRSHHALIASYREKGRRSLLVPILPPEGRVKFILDAIQRIRNNLD